MDSTLIKTLEKEKENLLLKLSLVEQAIGIYKDAANNEVQLSGILSFKRLNNAVSADKDIAHKYSKYDAGSPIRDKIICIIKTEGRFLHVREIAAIAHQLEWHVPVGDFIKKISPALSFLKKNPQSSLVSKVVAGWHFNTFWGSKNWLDEKGEIMLEYMYRADQLPVRNKQQLQL